MYQAIFLIIFVIFIVLLFVVGYNEVCARELFMKETVRSLNSISDSLNHISKDLKKD